MSDRTLSEQVAIRLGWSEPGSERSCAIAKLRFHEEEPEPKEFIIKRRSSKWYSPTAHSNYQYRDSPTHYATDIAACFRDIVEKFEGAFALTKTLGGMWVCEWRGRKKLDWSDTEPQPTPAEAICKAFLSMKEES